MATCNPYTQEAEMKDLMGASQLAIPVVVSELRIHLAILP